MRHYKNFEEYFNTNNYQELEDLKDEFYGQLNNGFIQELTLGTYNGATNTFTARELNSFNINEAILTYVYEMDLYTSLQRNYSYSNENYNEIDMEELSEDELIAEFIDSYNIFTVGNNIYVDLN